METRLETKAVRSLLFSSNPKDLNRLLEVLPALLDELEDLRSAAALRNGLIAGFEGEVKKLRAFRDEALKGYHKITGPFGECDCGFSNMSCSEQLVKKHGV